MNPTLIIDLNKLKHNASRLIELAEPRGVSLALVTKVFCADARMTAALGELDFSYFADSRLQNLAHIRAKKPKMLLRLPMKSAAAATVSIADISLCSELDTLRALSSAAQSAGATHKVVLMIDVGDLREGIYYKDETLIMETAAYIAEAPGLELFGVGVNVTCYGAVLPDARNLGILCTLAEKIESSLGLELAIVSGGNSSSIPMLLAGELPKKINNLRLGESLILGRETAYGQDLPDMHGDVVLFRAEIIELQQKPSLPEGQSGVNAFGEQAVFEDKGWRTRAIIAAGRQDVDPAGLAPLCAGVEVVGASSDHIILDVGDAGAMQIGDTLDFKLDYSALLRSFTSGYVDRFYIE